MRPLHMALVFAMAGCGGAETEPEVSAETRAAFSDLLIAPPDCRRAGPADVARQEMLADIDVLERVIRRGYAGFELAGDEDRWAAVFQSLRDGTPETPSTPLAFRDRIVEHLRFADDNHLGFVTRSPEGERSWRSTSGHHQAYYADLPFRRAPGADTFVDATGATLIACGDQRAQDVLRPSSGQPPPAVEYRLVLFARAPLTETTCTFEVDGARRERRVALHRVDIDDDPGPIFERRAADFPWLRVRSLATSYRGALERFVATGPDLRSEPVIVLDVRSMAGGSDRFLLRWFKELTSEALPYFRTHNLESEATLQGALNFWGCIAHENDRADAEGRDWLTRRLREAERLRRSAMEERGPFRDLVVEQKNVQGRASSPFGGRLLVVVDRGCASACETTVLLSRHFPGTVIIGENTEGTMKVGELRSYRLPASRIAVSAGHRVHEDPSALDIFPEGIGYQPDLWLLGDDPEAQIRLLATCLSDSTCAEGLDAALH